MSRFNYFHPLTSLFYFSSVLAITMFCPHPILLIIAFLGGMLFFLKANRSKRIFKELGFFLVLFFAVALTNPLFSHKGVTPLFFLNSNPVTLEALLYGANMGIMLGGVILWFRCFNQVMTQDKLLYLFGKISPKISLLLSSALRFIPLLKRQAQKIRCSQKAMGLYSSDSWTDRLKGTLRVYSALIGWSLENAIDTGASMKARGYGLKGRSHYSLYRFKKSDGFMISIILILDLIVIIPIASGRLEFLFYPSVTEFIPDVYNLTAVAAFLILSFMPFIMEVKEDLQWRLCKSRI